ncbi:unnamed protein product [Gongylonema pulchrum]|uniref:Uncharacterized protein n=1 Tax=Gongylonema pulchrum TaxID=637853 RepID=A0A183DIF4_9BILA|nr:unnamed protein product [Gongylonema pulchrum]
MIHYSCSVRVDSLLFADTVMGREHIGAVEEMEQHDEQIGAVEELEQLGEMQVEERAATETPTDRAPKKNGIKRKKLTKKLRKTKKTASIYVEFFAYCSFFASFDNFLAYI